MPGHTLDVPPQVLPPTPPPKVYRRDAQEPAGSCSATSMPVSVFLRVTLASTQDDSPSSPDTENESEAYVLSSYGDLSFTEGFMISSTGDTSPPVVDPIQPKHARPRFRLKVRRPPMPKRRLSYVYAGGPFTGSVDRRTEDGKWPGSPDPFRNSPRHQHQPLVSPLSSPNKFAQVTTPQETSLQRGSDVSIPCPKSPQGSLVNITQKGSELPKNANPAKRGPDRQAVPHGSSSSSPTASSVIPAQPKSQQEKPTSGGGGWRTRLPPRLPLPKWDM
ncbi:hypothetical protein BKA82DRAFT_992219 [Pisolithus tinctorius]|uniref:Uncharacterized protein n=1 Tax=Pisolithus tinctorius Marx 270 TaxID=870435 RepID=A0A0C3JXV5_PISTI|nr:hypothetical protein BKA82DRAFT_992219 [Pisolithus tinctorius]KIO13968.1 hypothetical protein M404DRAFT_992219 [Pisolithus tinctorius Marx 270]